jgi:hypothetical protein
MRPSAALRASTAAVTAATAAAAGRRTASSSSAAAAPPLTTKDIGDALEERVAALLRAEGRWRVRRDVRLTDRHGNLSQIDVAYGWLAPTYVECKNYTSGKAVSLGDVAKFSSVLQLNGVPLSRGLFVTSSTYVPRALTIGVRTVDGAQLAAWEARVAARAARRAWLRGVAGSVLVAAALLGAAPYAADASGVEALQAGRPAGDALRGAHALLVSALRATADAAQAAAADGGDGIASLLLPHRAALQRQRQQRDDDGGGGSGGCSDGAFAGRLPFSSAAAGSSIRAVLRRQI